MTIEEINILQDIVDIYEKEDMYPTLNDKQVRTIKKAIKALEQEDVLDKIRAEIIQMPTISFNANDVYKADVLAIIDKYKAESEVEDNVESEVEVYSSNFIQLKNDVLNNKQLWRKLREIKDEDSD